MTELLWKGLFDLDDCISGILIWVLITIQMRKYSHHIMYDMWRQRVTFTSITYRELLSHFEEEFPEILSLTFQLWITNKLSAYVCLKDRNLKKVLFPLPIGFLSYEKKFLNLWRNEGVVAVGLAIFLYSLFLKMIEPALVRRKRLSRWANSKTGEEKNFG